MDQARFRCSNERLRRTAAHIRFEPTDRVPFLCECADRECFEVVMLSLEEYDRLRTHPCWFLLVAGHEDDESTQERIVEAENGYAIVEKIDAGPEGASPAPTRRLQRLVRLQGVQVHAVCRPRLGGSCLLKRSRGLPSHEPAFFFSWGPTEGNIMRNRLRRVLERLRAAAGLDRAGARLGGIRAGQRAQ